MTLTRTRSEHLHFIQQCARSSSFKEQQWGSRSAGHGAVMESPHHGVHAEPEGHSDCGPPSPVAGTQRRRQARCTGQWQRWKRCPEDLTTRASTLQVTNEGLVLFHIYLVAFNLHPVHLLFLVYRFTCFGQRHRIV